MAVDTIAVPRGYEDSGIAQGSEAGTMSYTELLPCPFCGGAAEIDRSPEHFEYGTGGPNSVTEYGYLAYCTSCSVYTSGGDVPPNDYETAAKEWNKRAAPTPNNVPLYSNEQIDDIVDNHIFLDNGTSTYRVWDDRANKYLREMRDRYEREIAFWQRYGVVKNLELVDARQKGGYE